ncbi:hypothetical protein GETHPA_30020 [Geothrix rubra]|uniref:SpoIIAA-like protein n=1 Tax=Geothrix rubra TaxID=2927977 RepID=A0ABQ5Q9W5_9BACT|nr:hypothetical protein [Geothrix rubra]GLH71468.1 hypothetical protein GETHPA_30020 [Geothrix rubra]
MPITYTIDVEAGTLLVTWRGEVSLQELARHWDTLLKDDAFHDIARAITDLRESTFAFSNTEFWRTIDHHYRDVIEHKPLKVAILVANEEHEKYAGIWTTLVPKTVTVGLFYDPTQASAWLQSDPDAEPVE